MTHSFPTRRASGLDWGDDAPVIQARRQAKWLARYLSESLGREIPVIPAIALPGWWIDRTEASKRSDVRVFTPMGKGADFLLTGQQVLRSEEHTSELQSLMRISYAVFCLKKKTQPAKD